MTAPSSHGSASRQPLIHNGRPVPNVIVRRTASGRIAFEYLARVNGKKRRQTLKATTPTDAIREADRLRPLSHDGRIGDRSVRVEALYRDLLIGMKDGSFTYAGKPYAPRSIDLLEQRAESHVLPALGRSTRVADITAAHLRMLSARLTAQGLSGSTVRGCLSASSTLLRFAVERDVIDRNPANDIGRGERPSAKRTTEPRYCSVPEVDLLFSVMTDESRPIAVAMFFGALRVSEALSLRWSDVGTDTLRVRGTKTEASADVIPLLPRLREELRSHRERSARLGFDRVHPDELVFQTRTGKPVSRRNVLRAIHAAGDKVGLNGEGQEKVGAHDLRHSMAANALALGLSMTETARLLRHANPNVTATVYADLTDEGVEALGQKLAAL